MNFSFHGIGALCATFAADDAADGQVVKISDQATVAPCGNGDAFCGIVRSVAKDGTACSVQLRGAAEVPYSGSAPTPGFASLSADGSGGVKVDESGRTFLVLAVDTVNATASILL